MNISTLYSEDRHYADAGLKPLRWCGSKWKWIGSPFNQNQGCGELIKRIVAVILLILPTLLAALIGLVVIGLKKCCPADRFTPREALLQYHKLAIQNFANQQCSYAACDLRSGTLVAYTTTVRREHRKYYWVPGSETYTQIPIDHRLPYGLNIDRGGRLQGPHVIALGEKQNHYPQLDNASARGAVQPADLATAKFAPILAIITIQRDNKIFYRAPGMQAFTPLPEEGVLVATGGRILPDGRLQEEALIPIS